MISRSNVLTMIMLAALGAVWAPVASAQLPWIHVQQSQDASQYSDEELRSFAVAVIEVQHINEVYLPRLQMVHTVEEEQHLKRIASGEMVRAVENSGMTVDKFNEILINARLNPEVADKVSDKIDQHLNNSQ